MTLRTRRKIFYTLVALFFVIGGGVVLYAQGWRLDFTTWRFEKVGGIYIRSYPENASIYLDGDPVSNGSGFLSPGTLISDLLPRTYNVSLKAAGYDEWQENAPVAPTLVVQYKYAVMVPTEATPAASSSYRALIATEPPSTATTTETVNVPGKNMQVKWITPDLVGILQTNGELYIYQPSQNSLQKLADDVKDFSGTDDGSMVAALEKNSLEIFSLNDSSIYYRFNIPNVSSAEHVIWYKDSVHLFIVYPNSVSFLDLADSALVNFTTVGRGTKPLYDPQANILYMTAPSGEVMQYNFPS